MIGAFVGAVSGNYIFAEPLREHFAEMAAERGDTIGGGGAVVQGEGASSSPKTEPTQSP